MELTAILIFLAIFGILSYLGFRYNSYVLIFFGGLFLLILGIAILTTSYDFRTGDTVTTSVENTIATYGGGNTTTAQIVNSTTNTTTTARFRKSRDILTPDWIEPLALLITGTALMILFQTVVAMI